MRVLFWGGIKGNSGPVNINKGIVRNLTDRFVYVTAPGKYRELLAACWNLLFSNVVVVSGVSRQGAILVAAARILGKRSVYIMHGCAEQEYKLNGIKPYEKGLAQATYILEHVDLILPVSKRYMYWFREQYPQYADRTDYIYNGVNKELFMRPVEQEKQPGSVAVAGGMTPLKNNLAVVQAVEALEGIATLKIYGGAKRNLEQYRHSERMGKLSNEQFLNHLSGTGLFVVNSLLESFSIAAMEAFACGCSLLVSERAGVSDLLALEETDIIHDPMDVEEIRGKIEYLLEHPNYRRLRSQFDPEEWSFEKMVENLEKKCKKLVCRKKQKDLENETVIDE